jgi:ABC-type oligopeptide transport system substrate-binding subunit
MMNMMKTTAAAVVLSALSFGAFAAETATDTRTAPSSTWNVKDVEAGSNIQPGAASTGQSMNDAFDVHKLVAGEWS